MLGRLLGGGGLGGRGGAGDFAFYTQPRRRFWADPFRVIWEGNRPGSVYVGAEAINIIQLSVTIGINFARDRGKERKAKRGKRKMSASSGINKVLINLLLVPLPLIRIVLGARLFSTALSFGQYPPFLRTNNIISIHPARLFADVPGEVSPFTRNIRKLE